MRTAALLSFVLMCLGPGCAGHHLAAGRVPGTGQDVCYDDHARVACPAEGAPFHGQDAQHPGRGPSYVDNGDGTITDAITGLTWTRALSANMGFSDALVVAKALRTGGHDDWRLPNIKELYSLIDFRGHFGTSATTSKPFLDTRYFELPYASGATDTGARAEGSRFFDVQLWSSTAYVGTTMDEGATVFGVNFADGRIKGYPQYVPGSNGAVPQKYAARFVRGPAYGQNDLVDVGDGTVMDRSSGLIWQKRDDGVVRTWADALAACDTLVLGGARDWRLPNVKELQFLVDYTRAPAVTGTAAIAPPLETSTVESYFWTSTTLLDGPDEVAPSKAAYVAFGRALGWMPVPPGSSTLRLIDVHGAGAQRADPKSGDPAQFPHGFGPQGDEVRIKNFVRCVRDAH